MCINSFVNNFNQRHVFSYDDLKVLKNKYPKIIFNNIPEAWVYEIDRVLNKLSDKDNIYSISQKKGMPEICFSKVLEDKNKDKKIIYKLLEDIINLDVDLLSSNLNESELN